MKNLLLGVLISLVFALSWLLYIGTQGSAASPSDYSAETAKRIILSEMGIFKMAVLDYLALQGEAPTYLSDLGFKISEATWKNVAQVQIAEGGKIVALLRRKEDGWIALTPSIGDMAVHWACTTNVEEYVGPSCEFEDAQYIVKRPSFDCSIATTPIEKATCDYDRLMHTDNKLNTAYRNYWAAAGSHRQDEIKQEQIDWLGRREDWCTDPSEVSILRCIDRETLVRIDELYEMTKTLTRHVPTE